LAYSLQVEFIEIPIFTRLIRALLPDSEYRLLQWALLGNPKAGAVIPKGAGLRKIRWSQPGRGKRGSLRVIYFWDDSADAIYLLYVYSKADVGDLTQAQLRELATLVREELK